MKMVSRAALGLMLGIVAPLALSPAVAAKEEKSKAPQKKWELSKEFRAAYAPADAAVKANAPDAQAKIKAVDAVSTSPDERYLASYLLIELSKSSKDPNLQYAGVVGVLNSGSDKVTGLPGLRYAAGQLAFQAGKYAEAKGHLEEAIRLGISDSGANLRLAECNFNAGAVSEGLVELEKAIKLETAAGRKAPENWYGRGANMAYRSKMLSETAKWTQMQVAAYPTQENWRSALVTYRDSNKLDNQSLIDVFRLMHETKSLKGERDFAEYAERAMLSALPGEAKAAIEDGLASGAVTTSSRAVTERLAEAKAKIPADRASVVADEKRANSAPDGRLAANTGSAYLAYGENAKAIDLFKLAQQKGGADADTVNTRLGIALARSGDKEGARAAFKAVTGAQRKEIAEYWLLWLDQQA